MTNEQIAEQAERSQFEAWAQTHDMNLARVDSGYSDCNSDFAWLAWYKRAEISRLRAPAALPEGFKLVPVEPTEAMLEAVRPVYSSNERGTMESRANMYRKMIEAAPSGVIAPACDPTWCRHCGFQVVLTQPPHPDSNPSVSAPAANAQPGELPPMPEKTLIWHSDYTNQSYYAYTADQMQAYARAALAHAQSDSKTKPPATQSEYAITLPAGLAPDTKRLVVRFAQAMGEKLYKAELKYGYSDGWMNADWMDECRAQLLHHIGKGDPRDVANYCAFLWHHGESTAQSDSAGDALNKQLLEALQSLMDEESRGRVMPAGKAWDAARAAIAASAAKGDQQ